MGNATKFLLLAFSLALTCLLIVYFKRVADSGFDTSRIAEEKMSEFNTALSESELTMYEGLEVTGSDVVNFIKKNLGSFGSSETATMYVHVITGASDMTYYNGASIPNMQDFSSALFVKPIAKFLCSIIRDANDVIIGVGFAQR